MSMFDRVIAAVTPGESGEARRQAREKARSSATPGDWLSLVLEHHEQIERAFAATLEATTAAERVAALKTLALLLTGHANAEETVLYPALARINEKSHATAAYSEQAAVRIQMGLLEGLPPLSQEFADRLEHVRAAVVHHLFEEESRWFLELRSRLPAADQQRLAARYLEEFERYLGLDEVREYERMQVPVLERSPGAGRLPAC